MKLRALCISLILLGMASFASAQTQTPPISALRVTTTPSSGGSGPVTNDLPIANLTCGLPKAQEPAVQPGTTHNPTEIDVDDPASPNPAAPSLYCRYKDVGSLTDPSPLLSLPFGATIYTAKAAWVYSTAGPGPVSAVSNPFDHPGVPGTVAPTGVRVSP